jgi:hypothetical protein
MLCPLYAADDIQISASVDRNAVSLSDQIILQVAVSGNASSIPDPQIPKLDDFTAYSSGRSQNVSIINGKVSSSVVFNFILVPKTSGKFTIPPILLNYNGKTYQTTPMDITVSNQGRPQIPQGGQESEVPGETKQKGSDAIFVTATVNKQSAYVNEPITYTFKFFYRVNILSRPQFVPSDFTGFWTEDLPPKQYTTTINGRKYGVSEISLLLFPTKPGPLKIGEASIRCQVQDFGRSSNPFDDDFFAGFFSQGQEKVLSTKALTVNVSALPDKGKPSDFSGAVGKYSIEASVDKKSVKTNEPVSLKITVSGTGNMKGVSEPTLPDWSDFKKYETVNSLNVNKDSGELKGSKTFTTVIVPLTAGTKTISGISFSYFNPAKGAYETIRSNPIILAVAQGQAPAPLAQVSGTSSARALNDIRVMNKDITFIRLPAKLIFYSGPVYTKLWFILINTLAVFGYVFFLGYFKWQETLSENVAFARSFKASGVSKKYLKQAKKLLNSSRSIEFYTALSRALTEYIANKTNTSAEGLTFAMITELLTKKEISLETLGLVKEILDECDMIRFAPASVTADAMEAIFKKTSETINRLDKEF